MNATEDFVIVGVSLGRPDARLHRAGLRAVRPVARRRDRAGSAATAACRQPSPFPIGLGVFARRRGVLLYRLAASERVRHGRLHVETFAHRNTLIDRVLDEPVRDVGFYLDSGWPGDNYEVTMAMATALVSRGWRYGHNLMHLCFPHAEHNEAAWGMRLHLPMQFLNGAVARASRIGAPVLGD